MNLKPTISFLLLLQFTPFSVHSQDKPGKSNIPGSYIEGIITDGNTGTPIRDVFVKADTAESWSDSSGYYVLFLASGAYDILYQRNGYQDLTKENVYPTPDSLTVNIDLWEDILPPAAVIATANDDDTECLLEWPELPMPLNEIKYDNGDYDDYNEIDDQNKFAVKFTLDDWPVTLNKISAFLPKDTLSYLFEVFKTDGPNGLPGTFTGSAIYKNNGAIPYNTWRNLPYLNIEIEEEEFYISITRISSDELSHAIYSDSKSSNNRSFKYDSQNEEWSPFQDGNIMIRAYIPVNSSSKKSLQSQSRAPINFKLIRLANFNPDSTPLSGEHELINLHYPSQEYNDTGFDNLEEGWYAYAVASWYQQGGPGNELSDYRVSNVVGHLNYVDNVSFEITAVKENKSFPADSAHIILFGLDYPYQNFITWTDSLGEAKLQDVWKGNYEISIGLEDFYPHTDSINMLTDTLIIAELKESKHIPHNFYVDSVSSLAGWDFPEICIIDEDFEAEQFPPPGWQVKTEGYRQWRRDSGTSVYGWQIAPWDSYFAVVVDNAKKGPFGSGNNGCCDYLITPRLDLRESNNFLLEFDQFFTGAYYHEAKIEISNDAGETWTLLEQMEGQYDWNHQVIELAEYSGVEGSNPANLWISWHSDDQESWASGWAIDNVKIHAPYNADWPPSGIFDVLLDTIFTAQVDSLSYRYQNLEFGREYTAGVTAFYETGTSDTAYYTFISGWLYPPENFHQDTAGLFICSPPLAPWPNGDSIPENLIGYNFYVNNEIYDYRPYAGEDSAVFEFDPWDPTWYNFGVTALYELSPQGMPGDTGESMQAGPLLDAYSFGYPLPFYEDWESATFDTNNWLTEKPNWQISDTSGHDLPCAVFRGNDTLGDYNIGMISYPLLGSEISDGEIFLEFDLKYEKIVQGASQYIEIKIWENYNWHSIENISLLNIEDWKNFKFRLYPSNPNDFKIGFFANGKSNYSTFIVYIDNIQVYRECIEPANLQADILDQNEEWASISLSWNVDPPYFTWKSYNDGSFENSICSEGGEGLAQHFDMHYYNAYTIQRIRYFNSGEGMFHQTEEIYILNGNGEEILGGPYIVENAPADRWLDMEIEPIDMDAGEDFMIATFNQEAEGPKIGVDNSYYFGSLYFGSIGDFTELGEYGYYSVGSHEAGILTSNSTGSKVEFIKPGRVSSRELTGFNIWRNDQLIKENHPDKIFIDTIYESGEYCYYINALYNQCESDTTGLACVTFYTSTGNSSAERQIDIYPNPVSRQLWIKSKSQIRIIQIMNANGQVLDKIENIKRKTCSIDVQTYHDDLLFLKISTETGPVFKKIVILN